jgi:hypothetical protein
MLGRIVIARFANTTEGGTRCEDDKHVMSSETMTI